MNINNENKRVHFCPSPPTYFGYHGMEIRIGSRSQGERMPVEVKHRFAWLLACNYPHNVARKMALRHGLVESGNHFDKLTRMEEAK